MNIDSAQFPNPQNLLFSRLGADYDGIPGWLQTLVDFVTDYIVQEYRDDIEITGEPEERSAVETKLVEEGQASVSIRKAMAFHVKVAGPEVAEDVRRFFGWDEELEDEDDEDLDGESGWFDWMDFWS
ncbi:expressed unknown protein [Seminavis robusta]|nr:expressed unknown protein [Seminavis robusta]|eukprot:Sro251_g099480.1 n/a (127) ;mRNA; r:84799-85179